MHRIRTGKKQPKTILTCWYCHWNYF